MLQATARFASLLLLLVITNRSVIACDVNRTYSDLEYVEESGDLVGVEVQMTIGRDGKMTGVLLHYEGLDSQIVALVGELDTDTLTASGSTSDARVTIEARVIEKRLVGVMRYHLATQVNEIEMDLPEIVRPPPHPRNRDHSTPSFRIRARSV